MTEHEPFSFKTAEELLEKATSFGFDLPFRDSVEPLLAPITLVGKRIPNRLAVHPMEGFDGEADGSPGELTFRRYRRYAQGGSGLIWFEATSILPEGRSNPRQLMLHPRNVKNFKQLVDETRAQASRVYGHSHDIFLVLQLTHSGRFSKPAGKPEPITAVANPNLDRGESQVRILSDEEIEKLKETFIDAARLAREAGFDAVDIKACHGYLLHDLLFSFKRENSKYGGNSFENRSRFFVETFRGIQVKIPEIITGIRLSFYDGIPYPYGFGMPIDGTMAIALSEPFDLLNRLVNVGCSLVNVTMGIPYINPHIGRPFDRPVPGGSLPEEHPLEGIMRLLTVAGRVQKRFPETKVVGTGYSWLRQFFPNVGAAIVERGEASFIGLGRSSFAYPDAPKDLLEKGRLDAGKVCIACSGCTGLMRQGKPSRCVVNEKRNN